MKYIIITGGVISGIGKGIVSSSIGALLRASNVEVTAIKIDPYINIDAGTFSPYEHGEVYVLNDGTEVDLDLGNYERFLDVELKGDNNITTGKVYVQVLERERKGDYLGKTVQIIPHFVDAIREWIEDVAMGHEVCLIELGGTIGDIESMPFAEALRQLRRKVGRENFCLCHVNLVPCIGASKELKTKPTQTSVRQLMSLGLQADMIVCRSTMHVTDAIKEKISDFCDVDTNMIYSLPDLGTIYQVPLMLEKQGILRNISNRLNISCTFNGLKKWADISEVALNSKKEISIALVGKYTSNEDCYSSVLKSLHHACYQIGARPQIHLIESILLETDDKDAWSKLDCSSCLVVPGGFGIRGVEGKIKAIEYARMKKKPFLGLCLGFQLAVIEYARNVLNLPRAHSAEFTEDCDPVIIEMLDYVDPERKMGGTMRLGLKPTILVREDSFVYELYGKVNTINERHRHRYEVNPDYITRLEEAGIRFVGKDQLEVRMEILELDKNLHPYFVAVQFHPEYLSRPFRPSPPFVGLIRAARN